MKVIDQDESGTLWDMITDIDWSIQNEMDIIIISLGVSNHSEALQEIVEEAYEQGIVVVATEKSGNPDDEGDVVLYPARYDNVVTVATMNRKD